jgi:hypothetical protein
MDLSKTDAISSNTCGVPEAPLLDSSNKPKAMQVSDSAAMPLSTKFAILNQSW